MIGEKKSFNKYFKASLFISLLLLACTSTLYIDFLNNQNNFVRAESGKMGVRLEVAVYDAEGNLKQKVIKDNDMILQNFNDFLTAFFTDNYPTDVECDLQDITDTQRTFVVHTVGDCEDTIADSLSDTEDKGGFIGIGTDATAPERDDFDLGTQQESLTQNDPTYPAYSSGSGYVVCQATITSTGTYNVVEAGYYVNWVDENGTVYTIMLMHDTFNPVAVIPTDDIIVSYSLILSGVEFNRNFGNWLAVLLGTCADGDQESATLRSITDVEGPFFVYRGNSEGWIGQYDAGQAIDGNVIFRISESSTAPTRTTNEITDLVENYYVPNPLPTNTDTNSTIRTSITVSANRSVKASALYIYVPSTVVVWYQILMIHTTFSTVEVESGTALSVIDILTYT